MIRYVRHFPLLAQLSETHCFGIQNVLRTPTITEDILVSAVLVCPAQYSYLYMDAQFEFTFDI